MSSPTKDEDRMRQLVLMRHAKSSWANQDLSDHQRPLNERGRRAAPLMSRWLSQNSLLPDQTLCSTAVRTRETAELIRSSKQSESRVSFHESLYLATASQILDAIATHGDPAVTTLLVIGHNPGLESLASILSGQALSMPTAAIAHFELPTSNDWRVPYDSGTIRLINFVFPRMLDPNFTE